MDKNNTLIGTAMLTAIWDKTKKDNLELLKPFITYLIGTKISVGEEIKISNLVQGMEDEFGFSNIPNAVIIKIFNRMKKEIEKRNKNYYLLKDLSKDAEEFSKNKGVIRNESTQVISNLRDYLKQIKNFSSITEKQTENLLVVFLEKNGFVTIEGVDKLRDIGDFKKEQANYYIAKFILKEYDEKTQIFECIYKIVCGFMLVNTIYMQVENDNKASLKNVDFYLDTPLILNALELKTEEQNNSTKTMLDLLEKKQANIKCFKHNYDEVYSIIYAYKENIGNYKTKTLEGLDIENYTSSDVERLLGNLENMLKGKHIRIVDRPSYDDYSVIIDEKGLENYLKENYDDRKIKKEKLLGPDVESISAISRIRKGIKTKKIEDCKAIFVTQNYDLVKYTNQFLDKRDFEEIGYVISDVELTTVLWLKAFKTYPDLPKFKLIENARLSIEPSNQIMERFKDAIEKLKKEKYINDADVLNNLTSTVYYKAELMEKLQGDSDNLTEDFVKGIFEQNNENLQIKLDVANEKIQRLENEKKDNEKRKQELIKTIQNNCTNKANTICNCLEFIIKTLICLIFTFLLGYSVYITVKDVIFEKSVNYMTLISSIISCLGLVDMFAPKLQNVLKIFKKTIKYLNEWLYYYLLKKEKEKLKNLFDKK